MEEELALAHRALEDERQAWVAELNTVRHTVDDAHAQSVIVTAELEQLRKEREELCTLYHNPEIASDVCGKK